MDQEHRPRCLILQFVPLYFDSLLVVLRIALLDFTAFKKYRTGQDLSLIKVKLMLVSTKSFNVCFRS